MKTKGHRIREFFEAEAQALYRRFRIIETLVPAERGRGSAHRPEEGRHIESILRDFLNRHLPSDIRAVSGFIVRPATKTGVADYERVASETDQHSTQLDIIVYDTARYPVYERFEEFVVVPPEGVIGVISVKKRLRLSDLPSELKSLERAYTLCSPTRGRPPYLGVFAFTSDQTSREKLGGQIFEAIRRHSSGKPFGALVTEVSVFDRLTAFKFRSDDSPEVHAAKYVRVDCVDRETGSEVLNIPLQRMLQSLLGVYYDPLRGGISRPGFVSFYKGQFKDSPALGNVPVAKDKPDVP